MSARRWLQAGLVVEGCHLAWLAGLALITDGALDPEWPARAVFLAIAAVPGVLALAALKGATNLVAGAALSAFALSFVLLSVAALPLVVPAVLYAVAAWKFAAAPVRAR